jgi:hypothetical protein
MRSLAAMLEWHQVEVNVLFGKCKQCGCSAAAVCAVTGALAQCTMALCLLFSFVSISSSNLIGGQHGLDGLVLDHVVDHGRYVDAAGQLAAPGPDSPN